MTVSRYALVKNNVVENIVAWDGEGDLFSEYLVVELAEDTPCSVGWNYDGTHFTAPPEPEKTHNELVAEAESLRKSLRLTADAEIAWRNDAVNDGYATEQETADLAAWKKYRVLLMRVDTSKAPDSEWPTLPDGQAS